LIFDAANPELILKSQIADADIKFQGNDAGIGNITALTLDMSNAGAANFNAGISIAGTEVITISRNLTNIGTISSGDITITDTSTDPFLKLATSERQYVVRIDNSDSDKFQIRDVTASVTRLSIDTSGNATFSNGLTVEGTTTFNDDVSFTNDVLFGDNDKAIFGASSDLQIYHDGSNSLISESGTGGLIISSGGTMSLRTPADEKMIHMLANGAVELYHDNSKTFETISGGVAITGNATISGDLTVSGTTTTINTTNLDVKDKNITLNYGAGDTSSNADGAGITIQDAVDASTDATMLWDSSNDEFDFSHKITTPSIQTSGASTIDELTVSNDAFFQGGFQLSASTNGVFLDNAKAKFGTGSDLQIYHDGSNSYINDSGTGNLRIGGTQVDILNPDSNEFKARFKTDGAVELYYDNSKKFETVSSGVLIPLGQSYWIGATSDAGDRGRFHASSGNLFIDWGSAGTLSFRSGSNSSANRATLDSSGNFNAIGSYQLNGTTIVDSSRNLTNIGTISSGAITAVNSGNVLTVGDGTRAFRVFTDSDEVSLLADGSVDMKFYTSGAEKMRLDTSGNVGIGTTHPDSKLDVTGGDITVNTTGTGFMNFKYNNGSTGTIGTDGIDLKITANADLQILPTGNVGIGTSSPSDKVEVYANGADVALRIHEDAGTHTARLHLREGTQDTHIQNRANNGFEIRTENNISTSNTAALSIAGTGVASFGYDIQMGGTTVIDSSRQLTNIVQLEMINTGTSTGEMLFLKGSSSKGAGIVYNRNDSFTWYSGIGGGSGTGNIPLSFFGIVNRSQGTTPFVIAHTTGNVGIGTQSPETKLHVFKGESGGAAANTDSSLVLENNSHTYINFLTPTDKESGLLFGDNDNDNGALTYSHSTNNMTFRAAGASRMTLVGSSGNLGIGTSSPAVNLDVQDSSQAVIRAGDGSTVDMRMVADVSSGVGSIRTSGNTSVMGFFTGGSERARIDSSGNVGIGTTSPSKKLDVVGTAKISGTTELGDTATGLRFIISSTDVFRIDGSDTAGNGWNSIHLRADGTDGLFIEKDTNNVGIKTSSPTQELQVNGNIKLETTGSEYVFAAATASNNVDAGHRYHSTEEYVATFTGASERMRINSSGNVGIGTSSPGVQLDIESSGNNSQLELTATDGTDQSFGLFTATGNNSNGAGFYIQDKTANAIRLKVDSSGNVGIGTTSPSGRLTVQGAAEGDTYFTGGTANSRLLNVFTSTAGSSANAGHNFKIASGEGEFIFGNNTTANVLKIKSTGIDVTGTVVSDGLEARKDTGSTTNSLLKLTNAAGSATDGAGITFEVANTSGAGGSVNVVRDGSTFKPFMTLNTSANISTAPSQRVRIDDTGIDVTGTAVVDTLNVGDISATNAYSVARENAVITGTDVTVSATQAGMLDILSTSLAGSGKSTSLTFSQNTSQFVAGYDKVLGAIDVELTSSSNLSASSAMKFYTSSGSSSSTLSEKMRIDTSGNVGIGTSSPSAALSISKQTAALSGSGNSYGLYLYPTSSGVVNIDALTGSGGNTDLKLRSYNNGTYNQLIGSSSGGTVTTFETAGSERMRIDSSGKVLVGKTSDDSGASNGVILLPAGNSYFTNTSGNVLRLNRKTSDGDIARFDKDGTTVGSLSTGSSTLIANLGIINFSDVNGNGQINCTTSGKKIYYNAHNAHIFQIQGSEKVRIDSSGRVGIGTSSPSEKLHIVDTSNPASTTGSVIIEGQRDGTANLMELRARDASASSSALPSGQGGIVRFTGFDGTDFEEMAFIGYQAEATVADGDAPSRLIFGTTSDGAGAASEKMRITSEGKVGIGTTSPQSKLHVVGDSGDSGIIYVSDADNGTGATDSLLIQKSGTSGLITNRDSGYLSLGANNTAHMLFIDTTGNVGIGTTSPDAPLDINGNRLKIRTARTIANADDNGEVGEISWDANYLYVCVNTDTWKRVALSTW